MNNTDIIALIVVDYMSIKKTLEYIICVNEQITNVRIRNIIIDNSPEKTISSIEEICNSKQLLCENLEVLSFSYKGIEIIYYWSKANIGYARGNNIGTKIADSLYNPDYYLISNNDINIPVKYDWNQIKKCFKPKVGLVGPRILGVDGKDQSPHKKINSFNHMVLYYWKAPIMRRLKKGIECDLDYSHESKECYRVMGSFMFIERFAFNSSKGFDESTFLYGEELILSERLRKAGYNTFFYNDMNIIHEHGNTVKNNMSQLDENRELYKSLRYYYKEYRGVRNVILMIYDIIFRVYVRFYTMIRKQY